MWKKQVADGLTIARCLLALCLVWLGFSRGADGLPLAVAILLAAWITDVLDGPLARSSDVKAQSWVGSHDLHVDLAMATAALIYLQSVGLMNGPVVVAYLLIWAVIVLRHKGLPKSFGALFQGMVYIRFVWAALQEVPKAGLCLILYVLVYIGSQWKDLIHSRLPAFIQDFQCGLGVLPDGGGTRDDRKRP